MKRMTLISVGFLLAFAGCTCSQGWKPNFLTRFNDRIHGASNVGEHCDAGCREAAISAPVPGCDNCGSANYGGYEQVGQSYEVQPGVQFGSSPQSYRTGPSTMEPVRPKP